MRVDLLRERTSEAGTIGRLSVDGVFLAYTLEPGDDEHDHPFIAPGRYTVTITPSARFGQRLPLIVGVPGRSGLRVHPGNREDQTEGCVLLGYRRRGDLVEESAAACTAFQHLIAWPLASGETVTFEVQAPSVAS